MIGIPRACQHPQEAWRVIQFLYLSDVGRNTIAADNRILPAARDAQGGWSLPSLHEPDPFFGGQKIGEILDQLWPIAARAQRANWGSRPCSRRPCLRAESGDGLSGRGPAR